MTRPLLLSLAILAALVWAPSSVSAAGNTLAGATVSPTSGLTTTTFVLRVDYEGRFPATAVTATVAGLTLQMQLESGTHIDGRWRVATTLPAGSWQTAFSASAERGNASSLTGPLVSVGLPLTLAPTPEPTPGPTPLRVNPASGPTSETLGGIVDVTPPPSTGSAPAAPAGPVSTSAPAEPPGSSPSPAAGPAPGESGAPLPGSAPGGGAPDVAAPFEDRGARPGASATVRPTALGSSDPVMQVLIVGLSGVAAVALIGAAVLIAGRRRSEEPPEPVEAAGTDAPRARGPRQSTSGEDPILASLGIDTPRRRRRRVIGQADAETPKPSRRGR